MRLSELNIPTNNIEVESYQLKKCYINYQKKSSRKDLGAEAKLLPKKLSCNKGWIYNTIMAGLLNVVFISAYTIH
ncbi:MAG: hypothetical protein P0116_03825 [Candidatus Nitrosocosmicus sp.]|nr:hypothetical protein [Candidatus Nitrosocosmicus sp.]